MHSGYGDVGLCEVAEECLAGGDGLDWVGVVGDGGGRNWKLEGCDVGEVAPDH